MNTKNVENGLALMGALLVLVAVAVAATTAFNDQSGLDLPQQAHTFTMAANS